MIPAVRDWSEALLTSFTGSLAILFAAIPKIIGFILILVIGWFVSSLIAKGAAALLRAIRVNELAKRSGLDDFATNAGIKSDFAGFIALLVKWFIRLIVLVVAFDALGLPAVSDVLRQLLLWLPNLLVALVVLLIGGLIAGAAARVARSAAVEAGLGRPELIATAARITIWAFAIIIAANQIGVADELVNTLFMGVVAILVLALGLSFGLGGREVAAEILRKWYDTAQAAKPKIEQAAQNMVEQSSPSRQPQRRA